MHAPALFLVPYSTDTGYAIDSYCRMFLRAAARVNDGDERRVHFAFRSTGNGPAKSLPAGFPNYLEFDQESSDPAQRDRLERYIRQHGVEFVMLLDVQPVSPLISMLRAMGVRTVISYWGAPVSDPFSGVRLWLKRAGVRLAGKRRADSLIFESQAMADLAVRGRGCSPAMLDVVYLGTDVTRFQPCETKGYVHSVFGIAPNKRIVLFSGHVHERKGIGTLIDAALELYRERGRRDLCFLLCGNRGDEAEQWLRRVRGTGAEDSIRFGGYRSDMPLIMSHSDIGVIPSSGWDSLTVSSLEMAAAGIPVIVSRLGGLPEAIAEGQTGLVFEPGDASELADSIAHLADHPAERQRLGTQGRARVERSFTLGVQSDNLVEVFERRIREATRS